MISTNLLRFNKILSPPTYLTPFTTLRTLTTLEPKKEVQGPEEKPSITQRFKNAYKDYGKTLVVIHCAASICYFSGCYYLSSRGILTPELTTKYLPDWLSHSSEAVETEQDSNVLSSSSEILVAYLLYKIMTPIRYPTTIYLTKLSVQLLQDRGKISPIKEEDKLTNLAKESVRLQRTRMRKNISDRRQLALDRARELAKKYKKN